MSNAVHCSSEYHEGARLIYRTDAIEQRREWRDLSHTRSLASTVERIICRACFRLEQRDQQRQQSALFSQEGEAFV